MFANLSGWHLIILLVVVVLLFGAARLPALAKGVGQSVRILRTETQGARGAGSNREADADEAPALLDREVRTDT